MRRVVVPLYVYTVLLRRASGSGSVCVCARVLKAEAGRQSAWAEKNVAYFRAQRKIHLNTIRTKAAENTQEIRTVVPPNQ